MNNPKHTQKLITADLEAKKPKFIELSPLQTLRQRTKTTIKLNFTQLKKLKDEFPEELNAAM